MLNIIDISELSIVSDLQENEAWIEFSCQDELDNARLALSRALGVPEPVLYEDSDLENEDLLGEEQSEDWEKISNQVVDLQERMATGMKMIQQANDTLAAAQSKRIPYDAYCAWVDRRKALWAHWHALKDECAALIGDNKWLWVKYFQLAEATLDRSGFTNDDPNCPVWLENFDELKEMYEDSSLDDYEN